MTQQDKPLSGQESLHIIQQMIQTARQEQKDDGKGWIVWGWALFIVSLLTYLNIRFGWHDVALFWNIFAAIVVLYFFYLPFRFFFIKKSKKVKTYTSDLFDKLNVAFFIFLIFIILSINTGVPPGKGFILLVGLYGFWILIYGNWIMLFHAFAVLCGYIIPGHIANKEFNKIKKGIIPGV
jgi:hypothetical protein